MIAQSAVYKLHTATPRLSSIKSNIEMWKTRGSSCAAFKEIYGTPSPTALLSPEAWRRGALSSCRPPYFRTKLCNARAWGYLRAASQRTALCAIITVCILWRFANIFSRMFRLARADESHDLGGIIVQSSVHGLHTAMPRSKRY